MRGTDLLALIFVQTIWAGMPIAVKTCLKEMPVDTLIFLRYGLTAIVLLALTTASRQHERIAPRHIKSVLLIGVIVYVLAPLLAFNGIRLTQAMDVAVIVSLEPLATAVLAYMFLREKLNRRQQVSVVLAVFGVLLLSNLQQATSAEVNGLRLLGNLLFLLSLFCEGGYTVFGRALANRYSPLALSAYGFAVGFLVFAAFHPQQLPYVIEHQFSWKAWVAMLYLVGLCSALGYTLWFYLLKRLTANTAALSLYLQAVVGTMLGHFVLHEQFEGTAWIGVAMILVAVTLGLYNRRHGKRSPSVGVL